MMFRRVCAAAAATFALAGFAGIAASDASAALATWTGPAVVCAESLTMHLDAGGTVTLHRGHNYWITSISGSQVNGINQGSRSGWVLNGWFYNQSGIGC